jgi:hypothetical protein
MGYLEPPRAVSSTNITVMVNMLDVVSFSDEEWFQSDGYLNNQGHRLWSNYMKNSYIHKKLVYGMHCPIFYKTTVDCGTNKHPTSVHVCSKRMKLPLDSSR